MTNNLTNNPDKSNGNRTELREAEMPHEMKRRAKKQMSDTNDRLKHKAAASGKMSFKGQKHVDLMTFNALAEEAFVELVRKLIEDSGRVAVPIGMVYQEGAYELNVSPQTAKRYLVKFSARRGPLRVFGKDVMLNPHYEPNEDTLAEDE